MRLRNVLIALPLIAVACRGTPAPPSPSGVPLGGGLPFEGTRYSLQIFGDSGRCGDVTPPVVGTSVGMFVTMTPDATGWTARPETASAGTFTMRFEPGSAAIGPLQVPIAGSVNGFFDDAGLSGVVPPNGTRFTAGAGASVPLSGRSPFTSFATGTFDGIVTFSRDGRTVSCPPGGVSWSVSRFLIG